MAAAGKSTALRFVLAVGVVNLFADFTYEGGRSVTGAFLGTLGASATIVGITAGAGEAIGYVVRSLSGIVADRTQRYWIEVAVGYTINMLCVPALALAGAWPLAAGLIVGERLGRGIRKPPMAAMLASAGKELGSGKVFGINEALDQTGATLGPILVAIVLARTGGNFHGAFAALLVPALLTLAILAVAATQFRARANLVASERGNRSSLREGRYWLFVAGGALMALGFADWALIAFHFQHTHLIETAMIPLVYVPAMLVGALLSPFAGALLDRFGVVVLAVAVVLSSAFAPLVFLGGPTLAITGVILWGVGMGAQESIFLATLADITHDQKKATTFGVYDTVFGFAWLVGSALLGFLYDRSLMTLVVFATVAQLASIPFFVASVRGRRRTAR
jgi:MFS family permease